MKIKYRFVIDANVIISALLFKNSTPRQAFDKALDTGDVLLSLPVLFELDRILSLDKFDKYLEKNERITFLNTLVKEVEFTEISETICECRDPKDNKYLELAVSGEAKFIISGDRDLLVLNPFRSIHILTPKQFLSN